MELKMFVVTYGVCALCGSEGHTVPEQLLNGDCYLCALGPVSIKQQVTFMVLESK